MKLKVKNRNYGFGMIKIIAVTFLIILPLVIFQVSEYFSSTSNSKKIANLLILFTTMVDFWNTNMLMRLSLFSALFNEELRHLNSTITLSSQVFQTTSIRLQRELLPSLREFKNLEFGTDYNKVFGEILTSKSVCDILVSQNRTLPSCGKGNLAYLNQTVEGYLKWVNTMTINAFKIWEIQDNRSVALQEILWNKQFVSYLSQSLDGGAEREIFYAIMLPLASTIKVVIDPSISGSDNQGAFRISADQTRPEDYYLSFVIPLSCATVVLLIRFVYWTLIWTYTAFWRTALLLPLELILKNPLLTKYLRNIETSSKSRITFF